MTVCKIIINKNNTILFFIIKLYLEFYLFNASFSILKERKDKQTQLFFKEKNEFIFDI